VAERLSELEKWRIAELAAEGWPTRLIGKEIGRAHNAVARNLRVMRRPPVPEPVRCALRLSLIEREEISREVAANGGRRRYRACPADKAAVRRQRRPKSSKLVSCDRLRTVVEAKLELRWSPAQISGWLVEEFPDEPRCACHTRRSTCRCSSSHAARCVRN
jgi:IS30 family transposase